MTVSNDAVRITYEGNGVTTAFAFNFHIPELTAVQVIYTDELDSVSILPGSNYAVTGINDPSGGTVTYPLSGSPIPTGASITIARNMAYQQNVTLSNQGNMFPVSTEWGMDRIVLMLQQVVNRVNRSIVLAEDDTIFGELPYGPVRANKFFAFDYLGRPIVADGIDTELTPVSAFVLNLLSSPDAADFRDLLGITTSVPTAVDGTIFGNISGGVAAGSFSSISAFLDKLISTRGAFLRRGTGNWEGLALGTKGKFIGSDGSDLSYIDPPVGDRGFSGLVINTATAATATIAANWVTVATAANVPLLLRTLSLTVDTAVSGANGLDTGVIANNSWYSVWAIYNPTTNTPACLISLSEAAPTMPSGFTYKARLGWLRTNGSAQLVGTIQRGKKVQYKATVVGAVGASGNVTTPTWTSVSISALVPATAAEIDVYTYTNTVSGIVIAAPNNSFGGISSPSNPPPVAARYVNATYDSLFVAKTSFVLESTDIYYACSAGGALYIAGWIDNL